MPPAATPTPALRPDQVRRYARHILLPDVGGVGQARLLAATVAVVDGDAGAVAFDYLARAGVGALVLVGDGGAPLDAAACARRPYLLDPAGAAGQPRAALVAAWLAQLGPDVTVTWAPHPPAGVPVAAPDAELAVDEAADPAEVLRAGARAAIAVLHRLVAAGARPGAGPGAGPGVGP
ncbi:MAG: hypothetical protein KA190_07895 [Kofleriaceae bacterium]|nr:hypothetical protein [Kofleriaceae bacterium]